MQFTDIKKTIPSTTQVSINGDKLINYLVTEYNLNLNQLPFKTIITGIEYLFKNFHFKKSIYFHPRNSKIDKIIKIFIKKNLKNVSIKFINEYHNSLSNTNFNNELVEEMIKNPVIFTNTTDSNIKKYLDNGCYVYLFDYMEYRYPLFNMFVLTPFSDDYKNIHQLLDDKNIENENIYYENDIENLKESFQEYLKSLKIEYNELLKKCNNDIKNYYLGNKILSQKIINMIYNECENLEYFIDGRVLLKFFLDNNLDKECINIESINKENIALTDKKENKCSDKDNKINDNSKYEWSGAIDFMYDEEYNPTFKPYDSKYTEYELSIVKKDESSIKNHQKYNLHLKKLASSIYGDVLLYKPLVKEKTSKVKLSKKQLKIIEENEKLQRAKEMEKEKLFLQGFFMKYKNASDEGKIRMLENINFNSEFIKMRILLLKIEFYYNRWSLEKRKEIVDQGVMVPFYMACLEFLKMNADEKMVNFVVEKLIECGFEATVNEIFIKKEIENKKLNLKDTKKKNKNFKKEDVNPEEIQKIKIDDYDLTFQMKYAGDKLERNLNPKNDSRVLFKPDSWQVELLDIVDANKSAVISAPTSAGKTFICYYAIEKVLRNSETDRVIFCLPTKALANQVVADIYARFSQNYQRKMHIQGILMPDFQINPEDSQVLVTVPSMLEALLKTEPENIKYIIIDEIHKIQSEEMGVSIERVIHLAPCPILVLSATLGNLYSFYNWIKAVELLKGRECNLVLHNERYCDLKLYNFSENKLTHIHPIYSLEMNFYKDSINEKDNIFKDEFKIFTDTTVDFLPEDVINFYFTLFSVLKKNQVKLIKNLRPKKFFQSNIISKSDVRRYKNFIFDSVNEWIKNGDLELKQGLEIIDYLIKDTKQSVSHVNHDIKSQILPLLNILKENNMLPCIIFNIDREICNSLATHVFLELEKMDIEKESKIKQKYLKELKRNRDKEKKKDDWIEESLKEEQNEYMRQNRCNIKYTFLDPLDRISDAELEDKINQIKKNIPKIYTQMLYRGIGIHHNGMNLKYRELVEILFRTKHLRVVFSTETLSLGINMPCKSVIFAGDNLNLEPLNYRQMSGRAGRRGFDTLGNVIFLGIHKHKLDMLIRSDMNEIEGNYSFVNSSFLYRDSKFLNSIVKYPLCGYLPDENNKSELNNKTKVNNKIELNNKSNENNKSELNNKTNENNKSDENNEEINILIKKMNIKNDDINTEFYNLQTNFLKNISLLNESTLNPTMLSDLVISNKQLDPNIYIFIMLIIYEIINLEKIEAKELFLIISHLFQIKPTLKNKLPELNPKIQSFLNQINKNYKKIIMKYLNETELFLQNQNKNPIIRLNSFLNISEIPKNSYILDFFDHGNKKLILKNNKISEGELWYSCYNISILLKSIIKMMDGYRLKGKKNMENILNMFMHKFMVIFA